MAEPAPPQPEASLRGLLSDLSAPGAFPTTPSGDEQDDFGDPAAQAAVQDTSLALALGSAEESARLEEMLAPAKGTAAADPSARFWALACGRHPHLQFPSLHITPPLQC